MFANEARQFIEKLIRIQRVIERKGYKRIDQPAVSKAREHLSKQLEFYPYDTDEKMKGFWERNQPEIRTLIPSETHPAFRKLMTEFINLKTNK